MINKTKHLDKTNWDNICFCQTRSQSINDLYFYDWELGDITDRMDEYNIDDFDRLEDK